MIKKIIWASGFISGNVEKNQFLLFGLILLLIIYRRLPSRQFTRLWRDLSKENLIRIKVRFIEKKTLKISIKPFTSPMEYPGTGYHMSLYKSVNRSNKNSYKIYWRFWKIGSKDPGIITKKFPPKANFSLSPLHLQF